MKRDVLCESLRRLVEIDGPSGYERPAVDVWSSLAAENGLVPERRRGGNVVVTQTGKKAGRHLLVSGHIDEIGLQIRHVDEDTGCLFFQTIGGWDPAVLIGQRVQIRTRKGLLPGVVTRQGTHTMTDMEQEDPIRISDLWIDIGAANAKEASKLVRIGDPAVLVAPFTRLGKNVVTSKALDNRIGALAALMTIVEAGKRLTGTVTSLANTREEILLNSSGAHIAAHEMTAGVDRAIVIDLGLASDHPEFSPWKFGTRELGSGVMITRGGVMDPDFFEEVVSIAEEINVPYTIDAVAGASWTDADQLACTGVPTLLLSVPSRYMHSPAEMVDLRDIEALIKLLAEIARRNG